MIFSYRIVGHYPSKNKNKRMYICDLLMNGDYIEEFDWEDDRSKNYDEVKIPFETLVKEYEKLISEMKI